MRAFTLVEMLVTTAIFLIMMVALLSMVDRVSWAWTYTRGKIQEFQQARDAFDVITRRLSEATLNTYYDYEDSQGNTIQSGVTTFIPSTYARQSELRFLSGTGVAGTGVAGEPRPGHAIFFQAPLGVSNPASGLENLLNTCGFYLEYSSNQKDLPALLPSSMARTRLRLYELIEPSEALRVYAYTTGNSAYNGREWFSDSLNSALPPVEPVAENIIALVLLPQLSNADQIAGGYTDASLSPYYTYDSTVRTGTAALNSRNQLPPVVRVLMVAISETAANRMNDADYQALLQKLGGLFSNASQLSTDMKALEDYLIGRRISYRIFNSNVAIKAAKWSGEQRK
ncbi:MAG: Verru_Chthon cassette protein C [Verrucomicrobiota bacterium]